MFTYSSSRYNTLRILFAAAALLVVGACATPVEKPAVEADVRQAQLDALTRFSFNGGLGIWTDEQSLSARIQWRQLEDQLEVLLSGPLGLGNMTLVDGNGVATLRRANAVVAQGTLVDRVVQRGLGLEAPVPMQQLQRWVKGLPGNADSVVRDASGKLSSLRFTDDSGTAWQARFRRYANVDGLELPSLITASGGPYSVRLVLKDWRKAVAAVVPEPTQSNTRLAIPSR